MNLQFLSQEHKESMEKAFEKAGVSDTSKVSIQAPLYVLTSMQPFQKEENLEKVFNFSGQYFDDEGVDEFQLSTGETYLFAVAINLFNGNVMNGMQLSPHQIMGSLSKDYKGVYLSAIDYRYC